MRQRFQSRQFSLRGLRLFEVGECLRVAIARGALLAFVFRVAPSRLTRCAIGEGFVGSALFAGFVALFNTTRKRMQAARSRPALESGPMGRDEPLQRSRWFVAEHY